MRSTRPQLGDGEEVHRLHQRNGLWQRAGARPAQHIRRELRAEIMVLPLVGDAEEAEGHAEEIVAVGVVVVEEPLDHPLKVGISLIGDLQRIERAGLVAVAAENTGVDVLDNEAPDEGIVDPPAGEAVEIAPCRIQRDRNMVVPAGRRQPDQPCRNGVGARQQNIDGFHEYVPAKIKKYVGKLFEDAKGTFSRKSPFSRVWDGVPRSLSHPLRLRRVIIQHALCHGVACGSDDVGVLHFLVFLDAGDEADLDQG